MPAFLHGLNYTYAEYLGFEASSNVKHEFLDGQIYAMAGGTPEHAALAAAAITLLGPQLRGGECRPYNSDLRVRTPTGLTTYPDVTVIRGPSEIDASDSLAITNPALIVEVLSRSTEEYDSGDKFEHYRTVPLCVSTCSCLTASAPWRSGRAEKTVGERPSFPKVRSPNFRSAHGST
jgi:Uma2 family endonuclease